MKRIHQTARPGASAVPGPHRSVPNRALRRALARPVAWILLGTALATLPGTLEAATPPSLPEPDRSQDDSAPQRRSLEDLLREVEVERARRSAALKPEVDRIVQEIEDLKSRVAGPTSRAKKRLLEGMGPDALPLLVPYLDPGKDGSRSKVFRSGLITDVLRSQPAATVTDDLLDMTRLGTVVGRLNALRVLETTPEPVRAVATVISIAEGNAVAGLSAEHAAAIREAGFRTLAVMPTDKARTFMRESLKSSDVGRAGAALRALQAAPSEAAAPQVLALVQSEAGPAVAESILPYYLAHESLLADDEHARAVGMIAAAEATPNNARVGLLDLLRLTDAKIGVQVKREIEVYTEAARQDVRRAALLLLGRMNDRAARKALLSELDDRVRDTRSPIDAYSARATVYYDIGDWNAAVKDWRAVMKAMAEERVSSRRKAPYLGIARSLARLKKFREAADYLASAPISLEDLRRLATERDFREMVDSRYRDSFHLD